MRPLASAASDATHGVTSGYDAGARLSKQLARGFGPWSLPHSPGPDFPAPTWRRYVRGTGAESLPAVVDRNGSTAVYHPPGRRTGHARRRCGERALDPLLAQGSTVVLDLDAVTFMDSTGIRVSGTHVGKPTRRGADSCWRGPRRSSAGSSMSRSCGVLQLRRRRAAERPSLSDVRELGPGRHPMKCVHCGATL